MMTELQCEYFNEIIRFFVQNDQLPPIAHLASIAGVFPTAADQMMDRIAKHGYIERNVNGKYKFTKKGLAYAMKHFSSMQEKFAIPS